MLQNLTTCTNYYSIITVTTLSCFSHQNIYCHRKSGVDRNHYLSIDTDRWQLHHLTPTDLPTTKDHFLVPSLQYLDSLQCTTQNHRFTYEQACQMSSQNLFESPHSHNQNVHLTQQNNYVMCNQHKTSFLSVLHST